MAAPSELVRVEGRADVPVLRLHDPGRRNALSADLSTALAAAVAQVLHDGARAIVLAAHPPVFCAGGALEDLLVDPVPLDQMYEGFLALADAPVPTIAAVNGAAIGAGMNLPLACDVILATPFARFDPRFLDVGIHPGGGHLWRLERRMGAQAAAALVLLGEVIDGVEAERRGLVWRCVPEDDLLDEALRLGERVVARDDELVRRTKATLRQGASIASGDEAVALEREAQRWSIDRPGFVERISGLVSRLHSR